jgi:dTDP-4-amino-4,6-dideoxygalactose transaminase
MHIDYYKSNICQEEKDAVSKVLDSGWTTTGPICEEFESMFAEACGAKYALAVNSCTAALHLACLSLDIKQDHIYTTPMTYAATWQAIEIAGYKPIFREFMPNPYHNHMLASSAVIIHYAGQLYHLDGFEYLIEDCAHRFPARLNGDIACYSFYANKLITTGEGGMFVTNDKEVRDFVYSMRYHGRDKYSGDYNLKYPVGYKYNMSDINAAIGIEQLKKMPLKREKHLEIADLYNRYLDPEINRIDDLECHYHLYPIWSEKAEQIKQALKKGDIEYSHHYKMFVGSKKTLPTAYKMSEQEISLPIYMSLKDEEIKYICEVINNSLSNGG